MLRAYAWYVDFYDGYVGADNKPSKAMFAPSVAAHDRYVLACETCEKTTGWPSLSSVFQAGAVAGPSAGALPALMVARRVGLTLR